MKNLKIKLKLEKFPTQIKKYFKRTIHQTDTYYSCPDGDLMFREEDDFSYFTHKIKYNQSKKSKRFISHRKC
jgi:adenylate cyclase class IV